MGLHALRDGLRLGKLDLSFGSSFRAAEGQGLRNCQDCWDRVIAKIETKVIDHKGNSHTWASIAAWMLARSLTS
jgi:hypothetical protein